MKLIKISKSYVIVFMAVLAIVFGGTSCDDETTTDKTEFALYYSSLTDISPSMDGSIASPTYIGAAPSDFAITGISYGEENEVYSGQSFVINSEIGVINISNTQELKIGKYKISVSCIAHGHTHFFNNAVVVNFMKAVPEGIKVTPAEIKVDYADATGNNKVVKLPTAQVTTDGNHISITGYQISNIKKGDEIIQNFPNPLFEISNSGEIRIVKDCSRFEIGTYVLSLKLNTAVADGNSELGLFQDALKICVTSKPLDLTYNPNSDLLEEETDGNITNYKGTAPKYVGSTEGLNLSIASVIPSDGKDKFTIDPTTGAISVAEGHGFKKGASYVVSVLAKNEFSTEGVLFEDVFKLEIVEFIAPIEHFNYTETTVKQAMKFNIQKNPDFKGGGNLKFELSAADKAKYKGILTLNEETGEISAEKYNKLSIGTYDINVIATNNKGSEKAIVKLNIVENKNFFSYISYGNNINDSKKAGNIFDNQFRFYKDSEMNQVKLTASTDIKEAAGLKWTVEAKSQMKGIVINTNNGELTLSKEGWKTHQLGYIFVTATKGEGEESITRTVPVFFHFSGKIGENTIEYTPFVLHVNPKVGGRSVVPDISKRDGFLMDYRRSFVYNNIDGVRNDGTPLESGDINAKSNPNQFLRNIWGSVANSTNYGAKLPMSFYDGTGKTRKTDDELKNHTITYIDNDPTQNQYSVVVNPNVWYDNGWADGIFVGQMTFVNTNNPGELAGSKNQIFPIAIWLDKDFE